MLPRSLFAIAMLVLIPGCESQEQTLTLNHLSTRPASWSNVVLPGDTTNGYFSSPERDYRNRVGGHNLCANVVQREKRGS